MSTPITTLTLYRTALANDNVVMDVGTFRRHLLNSHPYPVTNCTFQRQNREMRLPLSMDVAGRYNYCSFVNDGRTFYAFITSMEYVNDNMTKASYMLDYWHTYQEDIVFKPTYIERRIVSAEEDESFKYTLDEPVKATSFQLIDHHNTYQGTTDVDNKDYWYLLVYNGNQTFNPPIQNYDGLRFVGNNAYDDTLENAREMIVEISRITDNNLDFVQGVWALPKDTFSVNGALSPNPVEDTWSLEFPESINGHRIKNKKLYTSPYMYINMGSSDGNDITLKTQDVISTIGATAATFKMKACIFPSPSIEVKPVYAFRDVNNNALFSISCNKFPTPSVCSSTITMSDAIKMLKSGISLTAGIALAGATDRYLQFNALKFNRSGGGGMVSNASAKRLSAMRDLQVGTNIGNVGGAAANMVDTASSIGGNNGIRGEMNSAQWHNGEIGITSGLYAPDDEELIAIDDFFSRYGYAIGQIESINLDRRSTWDFVQTKDASFTIPDAPVEAEDTINRMFDSGLTIWHDILHFKNYSVANQ